MKFYDCSTAPSPRRARILLAEKNAPHEVIEISLREGEQFSPEYTAINPACTVPALVLDDGTVLGNNAAIAAWLEAAYPEPALMGVSALDKAMIASWNSRVELEGFFAIADALRNSSPGMRDRALTGPHNWAQIPELAERGLARTKLFFEMLEARLGDSVYVASDSFSLADVSAVVAVDFARIVGVKIQDQQPNLQRWRALLAQRPSIGG